MRFGGASVRVGVPDPVRSRDRFGHLAPDAAESRVVSAVPGSVVLPEVPGPIEGRGRDQKPPLPATIYFFIIGLAAASASIPLLTHLQAGTHSWATFIVLGSAAALAQLFVVRTPRNQSYHTTIVFLIPAVMLLPPELVVLIGVIQHVPEWLKNRNAWYSQTFNICNYTISLLAAWASFHATLGAAHLIPNADLRLALAGLAAAAVLVGVNHILLAPMLHFYYSHSIKELGIFSFESLSTDLVLAALGVGIGTFWDLNPWLLPFAVAPLLLIHRSLSVPQLQEEARVDPKTGLFNARYFAAALAEELARSQRFERPMTLIMADLDLLRDINNTYGHLAGDAVLKGIAETFRTQLRHYDVPARFGGEEFAILLPETPPEQAFEIAERIRRAVAASATDVETSSEPIRATVSIGVAAYPRDGVDANELIHQADLAVYRAKLQGRNRVLDASSEPLVVPETRSAPLVAVPDDGEHRVTLPGSVDTYQADERRQPRPHAVHGPTFFSLSKRLAAVVGSVGLVGIAAGVAGLVFGTSHDVGGLVAIIALVGAGQALALELDLGSISVSAVGAIAGAALFGPRAALALALTTAAVEWSARRQSLHHVLFNIGALSLASLAAVAAFSIHSFDIQGDPGRILTIVAGVAAGLANFAVNMGLVSLATAVEGHERWLRAFQERFAWLVPHYLVYGFIAGVIFLGYESAHLWAFAVFAVPLFLMRKTQEAYLRHTQKSAQKLREAAETIQTQNVSLEQANRLLKER